ncbi:hypothetical protein IEE86_16245 [Bacillus sp. 28A-2]|uniref:hypothetical protein n=1 Tax=Bacillus sp. 28A-2 TaxID=2772252 RepID=UPI00168CB8CD|nr:hypothetical protein [Bacillus sp. 28A-2]MBD3861275.1 hypothetical protein [Bacillus sp. 28A-2]
MLELLNVILTIIASTLSIVGFITARENKTNISVTGNHNKINTGNTKISNKIFQPTVHQSQKIIYRLENSSPNHSSEMQILKIIGLFIVLVLFGMIYFSYLTFFNLILILLFIIRSTIYIRSSLAIKTLNKPFNELKLTLAFINMFVLLGLIFCLILLPIPKELTEIDKDLKFNISIIFQGGNSISSWLESVSAYIKSIWGKDVLFYLVGRSTGFIFITIFIIVSTARRALPTVKEGEKAFTIFSESMFIPIFVIMLIFCFLFPWIAFDIKDQLYPYWDEWLKG